MISRTEENYLKAIFTICSENDLTASTNAIAQKMETKASSVTDMLKRLNDKDLIHYIKYQGVTLTNKGNLIAISIIRKHRLWEYFLVEKLKFGWEEVHELAEQLEHIQSPELTNRLEEFLGYPKFDPHGDPIPNRKGIFPLELSETLNECSEEQKVTIIGVKDHSPAFLAYLNKLTIQLGSVIKINKINEFDRSIEIELNGKINQHISQEVAQNLYIKI